jgi:hypothetical protein
VNDATEHRESSAMTAIFAYAKENVAFVAGDTFRYSGLFGRKAAKVHSWSESVVIAQAGEARFLTELIANICSLSGHLSETDEGLFEAVEEYHTKFWSEAKARYEEEGQDPPDGTLLVAAAATDLNPARIHKVSLKTGEAIFCDGPIAADGTDADKFLVEAEAQFSSMQTGNADTGVELDVWACRCVQSAAAMHEAFIKFPADVLISRQSEAGDRMLVQRRMEPSSSPIALFRVPIEPPHGDHRG